jgi:hypothetical protein
MRGNHARRVRDDDALPMLRAPDPRQFYPAHQRGGALPRGVASGEVEHMAITGGFGMTMDLERGTIRQWVIGRDGIRRWADSGEPVAWRVDDARSALGVDVEASQFNQENEI